MSHDGSYGLTVIAFIGSVFSPYYGFARRRGGAVAENHVAINVALYGASGKRWAMTERSSSALERDERTLAIGPSSLAWDGNALTIAIDEVSVPLPRRIKGLIRLEPLGLVERPLAIGADGAHVWHPIAPLAHVEVRFDSPGALWSGRGYFDCNWGTEPLGNAFKRWDWSRSMSPDRTVVFYDTEMTSGTGRSLSLSISANGDVTQFDPPPMHPLPSTLWRIARNTRADTSANPKVVQTLEDTPFYARSVVGTRIGGQDMKFMHESLDLGRFASPIVQFMLPFRMPRRTR